eukprot:TRINITY_DN1052_c0_g1_i1.p1 TRINITY_DN1052_c0_g1~~TRINITY_DN1052_c0_g1_i1.p1  ORF type:complete len:1441 (-),score=262.59 TRINITY_DN1052_c0_g1_i1:59-4381(-)
MPQGGQGGAPSVPNKPRLYALVPDIPSENRAFRSEEERVAHSFGHDEYREELHTIFSNMGYDCSIVSVTLENYPKLISVIPRDEIVINLCDGSDTDGMPGPCVARHLEESQFTNVFGSGCEFIQNTTYKHKMKDLFALHNVSTPAGIAIHKGDSLESIEEQLSGLTFPLFVKASDSYGSVSITEESLCKSFADAQRVILKLLNTFSILVVEEFIDGPEFTILVVGDSHDPQTIFVFPPAQRNFLEDLPSEHKFLTFTRNWLSYSESYEYIQVQNQVDTIAVTELARRAYIAVGGTGYGRIDIRKREATKKYFVLEVNSCCGVGSDSSSDHILKLAGLSTADFLSYLLHGSTGVLHPKEGGDERRAEEATSERDVEEEDEPVPPTVAKKSYMVSTSDKSRSLEDEYHWLQSVNDPDVMAYVEAENAYANAIMADSTELQTTLAAEFAARHMESDESFVTREADWFYYTRTRRDLQYPIHCRRFESRDNKEEVLLDENEWAEGEDYFALGSFEISPEHNLLAFTTDTSGRERFTLYIKGIGADYQESNLSAGTHNVSWFVRWAADNRTLFFVTVDQYERPHRLYRRVLPDDLSTVDPSADVLVYEETNPSFYLSITQSTSRRFLFMNILTQDMNEVWALESNQPEKEFTPLLRRQDGLQYTVDHHGSYFYVATNDAGKSPNYRVVRVPITNPANEEDWEEIVPHRDDVYVERLEAFRHHLVIWEWVASKPRIRIQDLSDGEVHYIEFKEDVYTLLPGATAGEGEDVGSSYFNTTHLAFTYTSLTQPLTVYDYDMDNRTRTVVKTASVLGYVPSKYKQELLFATALDGEQIPLSIVYSVERRVEGEPSPCVMFAHGAYGGITANRFCEYRLSLLDRGFIFAIAHVRGDAIKGTYWYKQGAMLNKKNTFNDFICCAKHLIKENFTTPQLLAAMGRSPGGLVCGVAANHEEDLFAAVVADVPFLDVIGSLLDPTLPWTPHDLRELGNPQDPEVWDYMVQYSPYANVTNKPYPHTLFCCGLNDTRVGFWESAKMVLRIRENQTNESHILLVTRLEGHLGSHSRADQDSAMAFKYAFLINKLLVKAGEKTAENNEILAALPRGDEGNLTPLDLFKMFQGYELTMMLHCALELGVFEYLDVHGASSARMVARALCADPQVLHRLLDALTAVGLLERKLKDSSAVSAGTPEYSNLPLAAAYLVPGRAGYMGDLRNYFLQPKPISWLTGLAEVARNPGGETPFQEIKLVEARHGMWIHEQIGAKILQVLSTWAARRKHLHVLDMSCAGDTLANKLTGFGSTTRISVITLPALRKEDDDGAPSSPRNRISLIEGDLFSNLYGPYDLVVACNVFSYIPRDEGRLLLNRINGVLQPTGRLIIVDQVTGVDAFDASTQFEALMIAAHRKGAGVISLAQYQTMLVKAGYIPPLIHAVDGLPCKLLITAKNIIGSL